MDLASLVFKQRALIREVDGRLCEPSRTTALSTGCSLAPFLFRNQALPFVHPSFIMPGMATTLNNYFVPGYGISRAVIQGEIRYHCGPDAIVRPFTHQVRLHRAQVFLLDR